MSLFQSIDEQKGNIVQISANDDEENKDESDGDDSNDLSLMDWSFSDEDFEELIFDVETGIIK